MGEVSIRLPAAPPETYLRYVAWWENLERFIRGDPLLEERVTRAGGPISAMAVQALAPAHAAQVRAEAQAALEAGRTEVAPVLTGDPILWRIAMGYAARRAAWLEELAEATSAVPLPDPQVQELRNRAAAAIERELRATEGLLRVEAGEAPGSYRLAGELDMTNADQVTVALEGDLNVGYQLTLDLEELRFMDSTGVRLLIRLARAARATGTDPVVLVNPPRPIIRVLDLAVPGGIPGIEIRSEGSSGAPGSQGMLFFCL